VRRIWFGLLSTISAVVLMFSYHTSRDITAVAAGDPNAVPDAPASTGSGRAATTQPTPATTATAPAGSTASGSSRASTVSATYTGSGVGTRWGTVRVQITVLNGRITASRAIAYPNGNRRDQQINAYALPILNRAVVTRQSGNIDAVSGATVTSDGYISSVQSAIDAAHL
jgi:uncharacterized protein with FMN-binding domain